jgi:hypothetical protein
VRSIIVFLIFLISLSAVASTTDTRVFNYDGGQSSVELMLRTEKTHTEYRYENRQTICYRTQVIGFRTICSAPGPRGPRQCFRQPVYGQVAYNCMQSIRIPYEVKDYDVDARVVIDVKKYSGLLNPNEKFVATLKGDTLTLSSVGSKKFLNVLKRQDIRSRMSGSVKFIDAAFEVELTEAEPVLSALKILNLNVKNNLVTFDFEALRERTNVGFILNVTKRRSLASDEVVFDRQLDPSELVMRPSGMQAEINLEKLGVNLRQGRYSIEVKAFFKTSGQVLNADQFGEGLESSRTLKYRVK